MTRQELKESINSSLLEKIEYYYNKGDYKALRECYYSLYVSMLPRYENDFFTIVVEGAKGIGKSTFTKGFKKVVHKTRTDNMYYDGLLEALKEYKDEFIVFDRFHISDFVYSRCKASNGRKPKLSIGQFFDICSRCKIIIILTTDRPNLLKERVLNRDNQKIENGEELLYESCAKYKEVGEFLQQVACNVKVFNIDNEEDMLNLQVLKEHYLTLSGVRE